MNEFVFTITFQDKFRLIVMLFMLFMLFKIRANQQRQPRLFSLYQTHLLVQ